MNLRIFLLLEAKKYRLILILTFLLLAISLGLVFLSHFIRELNIELEQQLERKDKLEILNRHLSLEENVLIEHSRINKIAREKLEMLSPNNKTEKLITLD